MERIICLLIFLSFKVFAQDEFIFWAELSNKNLILFHQNETISIAMTKSKKKQLEYACEIPYNNKDFALLPRDNFGNIDEDKMSKMDKFNFLNSRKSDLIDCFLNFKIDVKDFTQTNLAITHSETYVRILPLRFIVEFNNNSFFIYYLK
ncbi:hypothetical protein [Campylobacter volucris]|uniref:hypothetical protein n=1 Tax=Campylobacter volucris TaxID=1031542 RepID=UPI00189EF369|nr:hypothetical protein [Campylobacter volucris]MBF7043797.1 hypothetical protein [Campylobacter volucris]